MNLLSRPPKIIFWMFVAATFAAVILVKVGCFFYAASAPSSLDDLNYMPAEVKTSLSDHVLEFIDAQSEKRTEKKLKECLNGPVILHFWATWCKPCKAEFPSFDAFAKGRSDRVLAIVSDPRDDIKKVIDFYKELKVKHLAIVIDPSSALAKTLGISALPTTVVVDITGQEKGRFSGALEWNEGPVRAAVLELLNPPPSK